MFKIPVVIDTDPGIDDFFAIMLANSSDKLDIKAITSVAGNQTLDKTAQNALDISKYLKMNCTVAKGASKPLNIHFHTAEYIHGESGLGNIELLNSKCDFSRDYAWDIIYKEAKKSQGNLKIIAIGPLTNIAISILKYPDLKDYVDNIIIMGGSCNFGNISAYSEFNIWCDPFAADIVFKSEIPKIMVGLDVTMNTLLTEEEIISLVSIESNVTKETKKLLYYLKDKYRNLGIDGIALHDVLAVSYVINNEILECKDYYVAIETRGNLNKGRTVVDLDNSHRDKKKNVSVAINVNRKIFIDTLRDMILYYKDI